jgi:hypothetical protein
MGGSRRSTPRAETGPSLRVQTGLVNLKEADVQSGDPTFPMCKRGEWRQRAQADHH